MNIYMHLRQGTGRLYLYIVYLYREGRRSGPGRRETSQASATQNGEFIYIYI